MAYVAFKPFALCPESQRPLGIPLSIPWIQQGCEESDISLLQGRGWTVLLDTDYDDYVTSLSDTIDEWNGIKTQLSVQQSIAAATEFGLKLMVSFAAENVLLGITQENKTGEVLTKLAPIIPPLQSGSLYEVITRAKAVPSSDYDEKYVTAARLLGFINKVEAYLGLPLSTEI